MPNIVTLNCHMLLLCWNKQQHHAAHAFTLWAAAWVEEAAVAALLQPRLQLLLKHALLHLLQEQQVCCVCFQLGQQPGVAVLPGQELRWAVRIEAAGQAGRESSSSADCCSNHTSHGSDKTKCCTGT